MRVGVTVFILFGVTCCSAAGQQPGPSQSTTTFQSSISGSATTIASPKYYVGSVDLANPTGDGKDSKKSSECQPSGGGSTIKTDLRQGAPYLLGESPSLVHATVGGCPASLTVTSGSDVIKLTTASGNPSDGNSCLSPCTITFLKPGPATIHAIEEAPSGGAKPTQTDWPVPVEEDDSVCIPGLLPQKPPKEEKADDSSIVQFLGNPYPYSFQVVGEKLLVYSAKQLTKPETQAVLNNFKDEVQELLPLVKSGSGTPATSVTPASGTGSPGSTAGAAKPVYSIEVSVPHSAALGDLATRLSTLSYTDFAIQDVGASKVRISAATMPTCSELTSFLRDLRDVAWRPQPVNPVDKLFFFNASDLAGALGSTSPAAGASTSTPLTSQTGGAGGAIPAGGTTAGTGGSGTIAAGTSTASSAAGAPTAAAGGSSQVAPSAPASSSGSGSGAPSGGAATAAVGGNATPTSVAASAPTVSGVGTDTLLFQDAMPGDDATVAERERLVALLDLPRPQMIINVWSLQASSSKGQTLAQNVEELNEHVDAFNGTIQEAIGAAWAYLRDKISQPSNYFDTDFYRYLTGEYVQDPADLSQHSTTELTSQQIAQQIINRQTGTDMPATLRDAWHICPADEYCLGYKNIFQPLKPRLTDLLVATIASANPMSTMNEAVNQMEHIRSAPMPTSDCVKSDEDNDTQHGHFYLECFRASANERFNGAGAQPSPLGLLRAALADFLFQYKCSQMYPHEFIPYNLSQSAQSLDAQLAPLVDAFNQDLMAYQTYFSENVMNPGEHHDAAEWFGGERPTFLNNGQVSVRTISGFESTVSTTSQNFLDATQMPTVSALAQSIVGAAQPASTTSTGGPMTNVLQNISPIQAQLILGALGAYQSSRVQIGRSLSIDVSPRSLSGASSAEITLKIDADESASPTYYSPSGSGNSTDISRVANHDTTTRVRVDSIKLFDVSTFTAVLQKSRTRFPLLPPFVEIPYVGTLIGVPLPVAKEFQSSTAVLSAVVVPTASDIALGLSFTTDYVVDSNGAPSCTWPGGCSLTKALFFSDLSSAIREYHLRMVSCLANGGSPTFDKDGKPMMSDCGQLSLRNIENPQ